MGSVELDPVGHVPHQGRQFKRRDREVWRIERMAVVDRNIMRASIYEFLHESETPKLVIIDEAIEIAKRYGNENSSKFVNGILDGILKRYNLHD